MNLKRLEEILSGLPDLRLLVLGDYFLDQYLITDPRLTETSLETGLEARQVVDVRTSPGAAGTVVSNLVSLGVGQVEAVGVVGCDGAGFELLRGLRDRGVVCDGIIESSERRTPTYTKPMRRNEDGSETEMERLDVKNRTETPGDLEDKVLGLLRAAVGRVDGVIVVDQVQEPACGVVTPRVREALSELARNSPGKPFFVDSRCRVGRFRYVMIKPNEQEARAALGDAARALSLEEVVHSLFRRTERPVFLTRGREGIAVFDGHRLQQFPALPDPDPVDPVGAGDSATAGIVSALCCGADLSEAARLGNWVAAVTIRKVGTTGTASPDELIDLYRRVSVE